MSTNCLIVAGEKSGEEHCLTFFSELTRLCPETSFWGIGGDELVENGMEVLHHLRDLSSFGFSEVILKIPFYIKLLKSIEDEVERRNCKVAILIDFQDFNLRLTKRLKNKGVDVLYYIAPTAWAWRPGRVKVLERNVHTLFSIFPFEKKWFGQRGVKRIMGVDHPLLKAYESVLEKTSTEEKSGINFNSKIRLLLLPGSRNFEVKYLLPIFMEVVINLQKRYNLEISIVQSPNVIVKLYEPFINDIDVKLTNRDLEKALLKADLCLAASGTVTLTTALFEVPTVVCYDVSWFNELIFELFLGYDGPISLANIIHENEHGERVFPEMVQDKLNTSDIEKSLIDLLEDREKYGKITKILAKTRTYLKGDSSSVAEYMANVINNH